MRAVLGAAALTVGLSATARAEPMARLWAHCRADESDRLIRACTAIIASGKETADNQALAFFNRGRAFSDKGQQERAVRDLNEAIRLDPAFPEAFNSLGVAHAGMGDSARAVADYDQALRLDPNYAIAWYNRGLAFQNLGRTAEAEESFKKARESGPRLMAPKE